MPTELGLQKLVAAALMGATAAGNRVYTPGDWATFDWQYPALLVRVVGDEKTSLGPNAPQFDTISTVRVECRVEAKERPNAPIGAAGLAAESNAWILKRQVERRLVNNPTIMPVIEQFKFIRTPPSEFTAEGAGHVAVVMTDYGIAYYQGADHFYDGGIVEIDEIDVFLQPAPPGTPTGQPTLQFKTEEDA
jgi:hypothetical protein